MQYSALNRLLGHTDLHLLDQILKGCYEPTMRVLDAGCGEGRNLPYFVHNDFDIWGVDTDVTALRLLRMQGHAWSGTFDPEKFIESDVAQLPFPPASFDAVICCSVLHFARDETHFFRMTDELWRVLKLSGSLFIRMNTRAGQEESGLGVAAKTNHVSTQESPCLLTPSLLNRLTERYPVRWLEPLRTEQVAGERARSTLIVEKSPS